MIISQNSQNIKDKYEISPEGTFCFLEENGGLVLKGVIFENRSGNSRKVCVLSFIVFLAGVILTLLLHLPTMTSIGIFTAEAIKQAMKQAELSTVVMENVISILGILGPAFIVIGFFGFIYCLVRS